MRIVHGLDVSSFGLTIRGHKQPVRNIEGWFKSSPLYSPGAELIANRCMARRVEEGAPRSSVGWHMDANLVGYGRTVWTAWIPLVEIDHETPGIEFACHETTDAADRWRRAEKREGQVDDAGLRAIVGPFTVLAPRLSPGSALVFNQYEIHRTEVMGKHRPRVSVDIRFTE